jgi:D-threo-aldose 1-dehydrogenase
MADVTQDELMQRRTIGRTGVEVTTLGFGAAPISDLYTAVDDDSAWLAVSAAWDGGVRYFDTAPHYGLGLSERRLGAALVERPRAEYVVSTKVGRLLVPNPHPTPSDLPEAGLAVRGDLIRERDYSGDGVRRSIEASLGRLGLDRIDMVLIHDPEDYLDDALGAAMPALVSLREQGVIGAVGVGMNYVSPLLRFVREADVDVLMVAGRWTLADRSGGALMAACAERDVSVLAAAPFNSGLLARAKPSPDAHFDYGPAPSEVLDHARRLAAICRLYGAELPQVAIQFPLRHEATACVVTGMRTIDQVRAAVGWASEPLPESLWGAIEDAGAERPAILGDR